jgi:hypothetical protein
LLESNIGELHEGICLIVNYVLSTGQKGTLPLNKKQCKYFLDCMDKNKTMILQVGDEVRTLNPVHVAFTYIKGLNVDELKVKTHKVIEEKLDVKEEVIQKVEASEELQKAYYSKELFQIECKCGEEYQKVYAPYTQKNSCAKCNEMVFVDRKRREESQNGLVWIMTNRYFVEREFTYTKTTTD